MKLLITGSSGFLGYHILEALKNTDIELLTPSSRELDLTNIISVYNYFDNHEFDTILHLAALAGGIGLNKRRPADLTMVNLSMAVNLYNAISNHLDTVKNVYNVGTICMYPMYCSTPFKEDDLWNGREETTNNGYSFAKKALLVLGEKYRLQYGLNSVTLLPANMYGIRDHFSLEDSHVIPALIRKFDTAVEEKADVVELWGTGNATREFLYAGDAADGILKAVLSEANIDSPINIGVGKDISIADLAALIAELTGFQGKIKYDSSKPDGQPKRLIDVSKAKKYLNWEAKTDLRDGLKNTIEWYRQNKDQLI